MKKIKTIKKNRLLDILGIIFFIFIFYYMYSTNRYRNKLLNNESVKFTIGKITEYRYGFKVGPWCNYKFCANNSIIKGRYNIVYDSIGGNTKNHIRALVGKSFVVKYSVIDPSYNEMYIKEVVSDSIANIAFDCK